MPGWVGDGFGLVSTLLRWEFRFWCGRHKGVR